MQARSRREDNHPLSTTSSGQQLSKREMSKPRQSHNRRRSRNKHNSGAVKYSSVIQDKILQVDPTFADFDFASHEREMMNHTKNNNFDFKSIARQGDSSEFSTKAKNKNYNTSSSLSLASTTLKVIKAAPIVDENNNYLVPSVDEMFMSGKNISALTPPTIGNPYYQNHNHPSIEPSTIDEHVVSRRSSSSLVPFPNNNHNDLNSASDEDVFYWLDQFTSNYQREIALIENSTEFNEFSKLREKNKVMVWWIEDLYEQSGVLVDSFEDMEESVKKDNQEFQEELTYLHKKLQKCHLERSHWKSKAEGLEYENTRNSQIVKKQTEDIVEFKVTLNKIEKDLESLKLLICRLRDGGVWDLDGLNLSPEIFMKIFGGHANLIGSKVSMEGSGKIDNLAEENLKLRTAYGRMKNEVEHLRSKIFNKERALIKVTSEYQAAQSRLDDLLTEEGKVKARLAALKSEEADLKAGHSDTDYDDFVKL